jgi:hypothetical protein
MMFGAPSGGQRLAIDIGVQQKVHAVDEGALLRSRKPLQHRSKRANYARRSCFDFHRR